MRTAALSLVSVLSLACAGGSGAHGSVDSGESGADGTETGTADTGLVDSGLGDSGGADSGGAEPGTEDPGGGATGSWGELTGDCGVLDSEEWDSTESFAFRNTVDLAEQEFSVDLLSEGGLEIYEAGNLGGSSLYSEILAYEVLARCEEAQLRKTEGEILYQDDGGKKTDLLVEIDAISVGVSVTRAYHYPPEEAYTVEEGISLLESKLQDVLLSASNVDAADAWSRSMLHVIAYDAVAADAIEAAYEQLSSDVRDSTLLLVTVTEGADDIVY